MSGIFKGTCDTAAATNEKAVTCPEFTQADFVTGAIVFVTFAHTNDAEVADITLNVNNTGAKHIKYMRNAAESNLAGKGYLRENMTYRFVYNGSYWVCDTDYDANSNTIGYQLRTNSYSLPMKSVTYQYRLLFTSADGTHFVPATNSTSTNATSSRTVCQDPIDPFGAIVYYSTTSSVAAGSRPSATTLWQQYTLTLGYSFNRTGAALTLTSWKPIYVKAAPQANGSAIIDADTPYVQDLPTTDDGKIYIFLGVAYSATAIELNMNHPVYYFKNGSIRLWSGQIATHLNFEQNVSGGYTMVATDV